MLLRLAKPFFVSEKKWKALFYLVVLLSLCLAVAAVQVWMSYANRDMMTSLSERNEKDFLRNTGYYLLTVLCAIPIGVFYRYFEERFALLWREWMTARLLKRYFFRRAYYSLQALPELDNPDQRIAEDVNNFTATTLSFTLIILNSFIILSSFVGVLYSISPQLVLVLLAYSIIGTGLTILIGRRLIRLHFTKYKREADLRYGLIRVRDNAESIAFFRGEPRERVDLVQRLIAIVSNIKELIGWNRNLAFFTSSYNYIALIIPIFIVGPLYIQKQVEFGVIPQAAGAFSQVLAAMSMIIIQFERISAYSAGISRLAGLWDALDADSENDDDDPDIQLTEGKILALDRVTVRPPKSKRVLVEDLTLTLPQSKGMLIMGPSGSGKSSVFRTIAGLWNSGEGSIQRPQLQKMLFLPQRPYMVNGTLKANLVYPLRSDLEISTEELKAVLQAVNLESVLSRTEDGFDSQLDWANVLSLGEQQRLSFGRLLISKPSLALLDEATSALDEENEEQLYLKIKSLKTSFVSIGHRSSLRKFHDYLLSLVPPKGWSLENLNA